VRERLREDGESVKGAWFWFTVRKWRE